MHSYSDEGTQTCGGFPGSKGFEKVDANTFASWGVDYLKLDGCYNNESGFATGYPAMGAALQGSGRNITYSCSWPVSSASSARTTRRNGRQYHAMFLCMCNRQAYLGGNESEKPWAAMIAAGCNSWRNWEDIDCGVSDPKAHVPCSGLSVDGFRDAVNAVAEPHTDYRALGKLWQAIGKMGWAWPLARPGYATDRQWLSYAPRGTDADGAVVREYPNYLHSYAMIVSAAWTASLE